MSERWRGKRTCSVFKTVVREIPSPVFEVNRFPLKRSIDPFISVIRSTVVLVEAVEVAVILASAARFHFVLGVAAHAFYRTIAFVPFLKAIVVFLGLVNPIDSQEAIGREASRFHRIWICCDTAAGVIDFGIRRVVQYIDGRLTLWGGTKNFTKHGITVNSNSMDKSSLVNVFREWIFHCNCRKRPREGTLFVDVPGYLKGLFRFLIQVFHDKRLVLVY